MIAMTLQKAPIGSALRDNVPAGVSPTHDDNIIYDIAQDANGHPVSAGGFGHPRCDDTAFMIATNLPNAFPIGPNP